MKVKFTGFARDQLVAAVEYIRQDRPAAARRFRDRAYESLQRLTEFPESGRRIPEFPELPYRELVFPPYRFFYRVEPDTVWIVAVWHGAQLPEEPDE